jgi:hypothetical protein
MDGSFGSFFDFLPSFDSLIPDFSGLQGQLTQPQGELFSLGNILNEGLPFLANVAASRIGGNGFGANLARNLLKSAPGFLEKGFSTPPITPGNRVVTGGGGGGFKLSRGQSAAQMAALLNRAQRFL